MEEGFSNILDHGDNLKKVEEVVTQLQENMKGIIWPIEKMNELTFRLKLNNDLLSNPVETKKIVVHTSDKLGWVIFFLSCFVIFLAIGVFESIRVLHQYERNDLLWRYVKVINKGQNLNYLHSVEVLYLKDPIKFQTLVTDFELYQKQLNESETMNLNRDYADSIYTFKKKKPRLK
jgi:hypothetical protein